MTQHTDDPSALTMIAILLLAGVFVALAIWVSLDAIVEVLS